ncbi:unnamed protein product [Lepeophtheirus salmonis]|uniref:(salmon louse) hypothetical protein n=1 Tax=Lepeophtheirus salmonis TaxID=72036 RepID=A0A7R8H8H3_LEPSM|nr:unnamed protein product [Lepeophtheirus salmonis]CAF2939808.1 unnamed protein product [Lepeophtheirus salmonis]
MEEDQPSETSLVDLMAFSTCENDLKISKSEEECRIGNISTVSDSNSNQVVDLSKLSSQSSSDCVKVMKSSCKSCTGSDLQAVDLNITQTLNSPKTSSGVIPMTQNLKIEKISPRVILTKNTRGKAISRTPPAMRSDPQMGISLKGHCRLFLCPPQATWLLPQPLLVGSTDKRRTKNLLMTLKTSNSQKMSIMRHPKPKKTNS